MRPHKFTHRTLALIAVPILVALAVTFVGASTALRSFARSRTAAWLDHTETVIDRAEDESRRERIEWLAALAQHGGLKAALTLHRDVQDARDRQAVRQTIVTSLREIAAATGTTLLVVTGARAEVVSGLLGTRELPVNLPPIPPPGEAAAAEIDGVLYEMLTSPIEFDGQRIGGLTIGHVVELERMAHGQELVLLRDQQVTEMTLKGATRWEAGQAIGSAPGSGQVSIGGRRFVARTVREKVFHEPYRLVSLHSVDEAVADATARLRTPFAAAGLSGLALAIVLAFVTSRSITRPLSGLLVAVKASERSGRLTPAFPENSSVEEVNCLAEALNGAARAAQKAEGDLESAYLQFVEVMAHALDARDPYTAGHSIRVGAYARMISIAMGLPEREAETIRVAAEMHDIGKIGVPDMILQKPGRLTNEEFGLIKLHPQIGRKILERVAPFRKLLDVIELHHENHDGTGYPFGLKGDQIPVSARIVHVADAFDAMTTDRSYRRARQPAEALGELERNAGIMFDPEAVAAFAREFRSRRFEEIMASSSPLAAQREVRVSILTPAAEPCVAVPAVRER